MFDSTLVSVMWVHAQSCLTLCNPMDCSLPGSSFPWNFPDKNTAVGCHFLPQEIFQTQGSNPSLLCLLRWQAESVPLCHWGSLVAVQATGCRWLRPPPSTAPVSPTAHHTPPSEERRNLLHEARWLWKWNTSYGAWEERNWVLRKFI